jgi:hypothetical protein
MMCTARMPPRRHVRAACHCFELLRSDGTGLDARQPREWFRATIGGLGLTSLTWVELQLKAISGPDRSGDVRYGRLEEFFRLSRESDATEYTVAWIDCAATGHRSAVVCSSVATMRRAGKVDLQSGGARLSVPFDPPFALVGGPWPYSLQCAVLPQAVAGPRVLECFLSNVFPTGHHRRLNRIYGSNGLLRYQCVIRIRAEAAMPEVSARVRRRPGSPLRCSGIRRLLSPGLLSFPAPGDARARFSARARGLSTCSIVSRNHHCGQGCAVPGDARE